MIATVHVISPSYIFSKRKTWVTSMFSQR